MARNENQVGIIEERVGQLEQQGHYAARGGVSGTLSGTFLVRCTLSTSSCSCTGHCFFGDGPISYFFEDFQDFLKI